MIETMFDSMYFLDKVADYMLRSFAQANLSHNVGGSYFQTLDPQS
jgi:hypothetical protein